MFHLSVRLLVGLMLIWMLITSNLEDGFVFEASGVEIRQNDNYKIRINNGWENH